MAKSMERHRFDVLVARIMQSKMRFHDPMATWTYEDLPDTWVNDQTGEHITGVAMLELGENVVPDPVIE